MTIATDIRRQTLTTSNLGGAASFSSPARKVSRGLTKVAVAAFADQTGTYFVEQSLDGTTWRAPAVTNVTANQLQIVEFRIVMPWYRVRYVNGATPQTAFALQIAEFSE
jgi:hypothetical protein